MIVFWVVPIFSLGLHDKNWSTLSSDSKVNYFSAINKVKSNLFFAKNVKSFDESVENTSNLFLNHSLIDGNFDFAIFFKDDIFTENEEELHNGKKIRKHRQVIRKGSECFVQTCQQTISGRDLTYERALEIVQSEEYLTAVDESIIRKQDDILSESFLYGDVFDKSYNILIEQDRQRRDTKSPEEYVKWSSNDSYPTTQILNYGKILN